REAGGFSTIILAAGKGTRMESDLAKVLHPLCGAPMLTYPVAAARAAGSGKIVVVIGHQAEQIREKFRDQGLIFVEQRKLLGTGHAVLQAAKAFRDHDGAIIILCGDVPLILPGTVKTLYERHRSARAAVTVLTTIPEEPAGYGRVVKAADGHVLKIVEEKDATVDEKKIREINTGIYCVESGFLFTAVAALGNRNVQREYYLTDIIEIACNNGLRATSFPASDPMEVMGINTPEELERAGRLMVTRDLKNTPVLSFTLKRESSGII
ncbi:MAG: NTP transferase domain-containing protein, partial [Syntrophales bacterium]|nr:NTP transferase domain-containing protein [Syntrophales bacterium]